MSTTELERCRALVKQLIDLGEDAEELTYWTDIFENMEPADQTTLMDSLTAELRALGVTPAA